MAWKVPLAFALIFVVSSSYAADKAGIINPTEAIHRLSEESEVKKIVVFGDSLAKSYWHNSNIFDSLQRMSKAIGKDWAVDQEEDAIDSLFERIKRQNPRHPLHIKNYATVGAKLGKDKSPLAQLKATAGVKSLDEQIRDFQSDGGKANLILLLIGHNDLDWDEGLSAEEKESLSESERLLRHKKNFLTTYKLRLQEIQSLFSDGEEPLDIVVLGLIDFESFLIAHEEAEKAHQNDPKSFPHLPSTHSVMGVIKKDRRQTALKMGRMLNEGLEALVQELNELSTLGKTFHFSAALSQNRGLSTMQILHPKDGLHLSDEGHDLVAESVYRSLETIEILPFR